jgi:DNA mismatch repair ATPase MutL
LREIAFYERRKIHDLIMEGIAAALKRRGYQADDRNVGKRPRQRRQ